jgi:hypothetical protein
VALLCTTNAEIGEVDELRCRYLRQSQGDCANGTTSFCVTGTYCNRFDVFPECTKFLAAGSLGCTDALLCALGTLCGDNAPNAPGDDRCRTVLYSPATECGDFDLEICATALGGGCVDAFVPDKFVRTNTYGVDCEADEECVEATCDNATTSSFICTRARAPSQTCDRIYDRCDGGSACEPELGGKRCLIPPRAACTPRQDGAPICTPGHECSSGACRLSIDQTCEGDGGGDVDQTSCATGYCDAGRGDLCKILLASMVASAAQHPGTKVCRIASSICNATDTRCKRLLFAASDPCGSTNISQCDAASNLTCDSVSGTPRCVLPAGSTCANPTDCASFSCDTTREGRAFTCVDPRKPGESCAGPFDTCVPEEATGTISDCVGFEGAGICRTRRQPIDNCTLSARRTIA